MSKSVVTSPCLQRSLLIKSCFQPNRANIFLSRFSPLFFPFGQIAFPGSVLPVSFDCMTQNTKKVLFISVLSLLVLSISAGIYLYNKGPVNIKTLKGIQVNADELYGLFSTDSVLAGKKYISRVLLVSGQVSDVSVNASQQKVILIKTGTDGAYINCTLEGTGTVNDIAVNKPIRIKGICSGFGLGDADLGIPGDVYLTRCILSDK
jgi:hypothetical protein